MRRLMSGLGVCVLASVLTIPVAAQEPSPPPWFGGRVEMPEHGFAVTLPDDWVTYAPTADIASQVEAMSEFYDPALWFVVEGVLRDKLDAVASRDVQLYSEAPKSNAGRCILDATPVSAATAHVAADHMYASYVDDPAARDVEPPLRVDLPAGAAYLVRMSLRQVSLDPWSPSSIYALPMGEGVLLLFCQGISQDDWLSIAETIEFLPEEE